VYLRGSKASYGYHDVVHFALATVYKAETLPSCDFKDTIEKQAAAVKRFQEQLS